MDVAKELRRKLKENLELALLVADVAGYASFFTLFEDARRAFEERPAAMLVTALASAVVGYALCSATVCRRERLEKIERVRQAEARRQKVIDQLARMCASMSENQKRLLSKALDEGGIDGWILDPELLMLRDMGILVQPSVVSRTNDTHFTVQPAFVLELREHREEWLS